MDSLADFERECFFIAPLGEEGGGVRTRSDLILEFIVRPAAQELGLWAVRGDELAAPGQITHRVAHRGGGVHSGGHCCSDHSMMTLAAAVRAEARR